MSWVELFISLTSLAGLFPPDASRTPTQNGHLQRDVIRSYLSHTALTLTMKEIHSSGLLKKKNSPSFQKSSKQVADVSCQDPSFFESCFE